MACLIVYSPFIRYSTIYFRCFDIETNKYSSLIKPDGNKNATFINFIYISTRVFGCSLEEYNFNEILINISNFIQESNLKSSWQNIAKCSEQIWSRAYLLLVFEVVDARIWMFSLFQTESWWCNVMNTSPLLCADLALFHEIFQANNRARIIWTFAIKLLNFPDWIFYLQIEELRYVFLPDNNKNH